MIAAQRFLCRPQIISDELFLGQKNSIIGSKFIRKNTIRKAIEGDNLCNLNLKLGTDSDKSEPDTQRYTIDSCPKIFIALSVAFLEVFSGIKNPKKTIQISKLHAKRSETDYRGNN